ncbi:Poly [ADP-ribose] polymerase 15 [Stylophora pistillata]|uniref:Poly [ADP-ribose] polymerase n=1 Tax=Stylophora pistillata TaxID=50429 RepID=A0A2B4RJN2_STYPI|nr:Poly [ADP-ribose] polymerase 15 [Stylophora pistillata]
MSLLHDIQKIGCEEGVCDKTLRKPLLKVEIRPCKFYLPAGKFISVPRVLRWLPGLLDLVFCLLFPLLLCSRLLFLIFGLSFLRDGHPHTKSMSLASQQNVQKENGIRTDNIFCSKGVVQFIQKYRWSQVRSIERSLQLFDVAVSTFGFDNKLCVSAKADGLGTALEKVKVLIDKVFCENFEIEQPGTKFGRGVYFARDAQYSVGYAGHGRYGGRYMYLAKVLVGQYCVGNPSMIVPPPKNPSKPEILYDSVVNSQSSPSIFVVFFDNQCYPEYLITF